MSALPKPSTSIREPFEYLELVPLPDDPKIAALGDARDASRRERDQAMLRDDLAAVAAKTGQRISIPDRPFTVAEWQTIRMLRSILRTGSVTRTWTELVVRMTPRQLQGFVTETTGQNTSLAMGPLGDPTVELFGTPLSLGLRNLLFRQANLSDMAGARAQLAISRNAGALIRLHFVPGPDASVEITYPDWVPQSASRRLNAAERPVLLAPADSQRINQLLEQQSHQELNQGERWELDALLDAHGTQLRERAIGLFAAQHGLDHFEAQRIIDADLADAVSWWSTFQADPARVEAAIEEAKRHRSQHGG